MFSFHREGQTKQQGKKRGVEEKQLEHNCLIFGELICRRCSKHVFVWGNCNNCVSDCTVGSAERWTQRIKMRRNAHWETKASSLHMTTCSSEKWRALQRGNYTPILHVPARFLQLVLFLLTWELIFGNSCMLSKKVLENMKSLFTSVYEQDYYRAVD